MSDGPLADGERLLSCSGGHSFKRRTADIDDRSLVTCPVCGLSVATGDRPARFTGFGTFG